MNQQTVIPLNHDKASLSDWIGEENQLLVNEIRRLVRDKRSSSILFFWGERNSGKSYLLEAAINEAVANGQHVKLVKLKQGNGYLESVSFPQHNGFYAIDDINLITHSRQAEQNLMTLYEQLVSNGGRLLLSGSMPLSEIPFNMVDLRSRIYSGGTFKLLPIAEENLYQTFQHIAVKKGIKLDDNVMSYIRNHYHRDSLALFSLLDKLDSASLQKQRKITIPFIKELI